MLGTSLVVLLMEMTTQVPCAWNENTVADVAKTISSVFYWMRFDELIFVFRKGMTGLYLHDGEYVAGKLTVTSLGSWLKMYSSNEREDTEAYYRSLSKPKYEDIPVDEDKFKETTEKISKLAEYFKNKAREEKQTGTKCTMTDEQLDERQWTFFQAFKQDWTLQQLYSELKYAKEKGWVKTENSIEREINERTL